MVRLGLVTRCRYPTLGPLKSSTGKSNGDSCFPVEAPLSSRAAGLGEVIRNL